MPLENVDQIIGPNLKRRRCFLFQLSALPTRDTSIYMWKFVRRETENRKKIIESVQPSLLVNEGKHIGEIKYKTHLAEKNLKHFFY